MHLGASLGDWGLCSRRVVDYHSYLAVFVRVPFIDKDLHLLFVLRTYREGVQMTTKDSLRSSMEIQM